MLKKLLQCVLGFVMTISMAFAAININTATEQELDSLPGIGPVKAKAIVDYRKKNGNFKSVDDIQKVNGIGPSTFNDIKGQLAVSGTTSVPAADTKAAKTDKPAAKEPVKEKAKEAAKDTKDAVKGAAVATKDATKDAAKDVAKESKKVASDVKADVKGDKKKADKASKKAAKDSDQSAAKAKK